LLSGEFTSEGFTQLIDNTEYASEITHVTETISVTITLPVTTSLPEESPRTHAISTEGVTPHAGDPLTLNSLDIATVYYTEDMSSMVPVSSASVTAAEVQDLLSTDITQSQRHDASLAVESTSVHPDQATTAGEIMFSQTSQTTDAKTVDDVTSTQNTDVKTFHESTSTQPTDAKTKNRIFEGHSTYPSDTTTTVAESTISTSTQGQQTTISDDATNGMNGDASKIGQSSSITGKTVLSYNYEENIKLISNDYLYDNTNIT
jgi:hypothetical protein